MGLVSRVVEEYGIATINVSTGRDLTAQVKPPRSLFVNHPMGNPFGRAGDVKTQREILLAALHVLETCRVPGEMVDLPHDWGEKVKTIFDVRAELAAKMGSQVPELFYSGTLGHLLRHHLRARLDNHPGSQ